MQFGRYYEEFEVGATYKHWPGKTITEYDDHLFCAITMNHHPLHTDAHYAETSTHFGKNVVVGNLVYSLALGMSVADISGKAIANLEVESLKHENPTFHGDTIYAETTVLDKKESSSKPDRGIVTVETRAFNQRGERVCIFTRRVMVPKRDDSKPLQTRGHPRRRMTDAAVAARHNVRALLPGPAEALRDAVLGLGGGPDRLSVVAQRGSVEALSVEGLTSDLTRVLQRELEARGGTVLSDVNGTRVVLLAPLMVMGDLPAMLRTWSANGEALADAIGDVLMSRAGVPAPLRAGRHTLRFDRTLVMGIVNVTPDSFARDSVGDVGAAVEQAQRMVTEGASIIDVGGESTRPNAEPVDEAEELRRAIPAVAAISAAVDVPVSIDTRKAAVARAAVDAGATIVNDIWGLRRDTDMASVVAARDDLALVAMHNQQGTQYSDLLADIARSLRDSLRIAAIHGIAAERVIVDPGFGFAKNAAQNLEVVRRLGELRGLGRPILLGASRKHTLGVLSGHDDPRDRDEATAAINALGVANGASIVRVHNVRATVDAVRVADAVVRGTSADVAALPAPGGHRVSDLDDVVTDTAVVATGANIGNRVQQLALLRQLLQRDGVRIEAESPEAVTHPVGVEGQRDYRNQVLRLRAPQPWSARRWLEHTGSAEADAGRRPTYHWGPRRADVDILLLGRPGEELRVDDPALKVPHPQIEHRAFVQRLLAKLP